MWSQGRHNYIERYEPEFSEMEQDLAERINERIILAGFTQMVRGPTHKINRGDDMLIDQSWNNCNERHIETENIEDGASDHNQVAVRIKYRTIQER